MSNNLPQASRELDQIITATGESSHIDAKGPLFWDGGITSARLAKHIAAFANSRDGGVIVIGKEERDAGRFELTGLTDTQAQSFETTKVAKWVNNRFNPPIELVCHRHEFQDKQFVIITVREFSEVPVLCTKSFQDPDNGKYILRECTVYVRNSQAESAPLATPDELRALIGIATSKRRDELVKMFDSIIKGRPLLGAPSDSERFDEELLRIEEGLGESYIDQMQAGAWWMLVRPGAFDAERWNENTKLEEIIVRRAAKLYNTFPASLRETHVREWGICNDLYGETWTLSRSGQFLCIRPYFENGHTYECSWAPPDPSIEAGKWLEFTASLIRICEMVLFAARLAEEYGPGERVEMVLRATGLAGRKLVTSTMTVLIRHPQECRASQFEFKKNLGIEEFRAEWEEICADAMKRFVEYFPSQGGPVALETMRGWVEKFKKRDV